MDWEMGYKQQTIHQHFIQYTMKQEIDTATIKPRKYDQKSTKGLGKLN